MGGEALNDRVAAFVREILEALGLELDVSLERRPDHLRINLEGRGGEPLLRRRAEGLEALQHLVNTKFRRGEAGQEHFVVDCLGYRRAKEAELRQMARFLIEKAKATGVPQEIGPLNPYNRRVVHLAVSEDPDASSESVGDAYLKTVVITARRR
ncbi:MAG TPA: R3H domain-containing nucleic acid-binding protein [Vicinamibacterales bacterium]|nr:R3H domain-containing nucleic acid-binding protein [Vicinamibacterales bacterium]